MRLIRILTWLLFILLMALGFWIASHRPLWNDEYYSLFTSTLGYSYKWMLAGRIGEGNNSPLFYMLQKAQCNLFSYHPPQEWIEGRWGSVHVFDQFFLRIQSVVFMSAALSALFYYFGRRNLWLGIYALAVTLTSSLFWIHWTEARPYAGWFALSIVQIVLLLNILESPVDQNKKKWLYFIAVHCLLALISIVSVIQIMAAGIVLWMFRRSGLMTYIPLIIIPLGICCFYYIRAPHYPSFFVDGPIALLNANVPKDRLFIIFMSAAVLLFQSRSKNWIAHLESKYLVFFLLMLGAFGLVLLKLKFAQTGGGFQVSSRYFLSLTPAGIVGTVLFSEYLVHAFPSKIWKAVMIVILAVFLMFRLHKVDLQISIKLLKLNGNSY